MFSDRDLLFQVAETTDMPAFSGQYAKKVLLVALDEPEANDNQLFVQKLLQAANIQLASDTFFCFLKADEKLQLGALIKEKQPDQVLLFGLNPAQLSLHLQIKPYQPVIFYETTLLFADKLSVLAPNKDLKTKMWTAMKEIFKI